MNSLAIKNMIITWWRPANKRNSYMVIQGIFIHKMSLEFLQQLAIKW